MTVPVSVVGDEVIVGYNEPELLRAIERLKN